MKSSIHPIEFDLPKLLVENLPWVKEFYSSQTELKSDVTELFDFPLRNAKAMPFYELSEAGHRHVIQVAEDAYQVMLDALEYAFEYPDILKKFFDCDMLRSQAGAEFIEYAKFTFSKRNMLGQSLYSRFDFAFDPVTEKVTGIYELNADTPTMLFESTTVQDYLVKQVAHEDAQVNNWYLATTTALRDLNIQSMNNRFGVVFDSEYIEDSATCEIIADLMSQFGATLMVDIKALDYEHMNLSKPFQAYGHELDGMFILSPWEEMVVNFPTAFLQWREWADNVAVIEPAWKWFMSNKGMLALVTYLLERNMIDDKYKDLPFLKTYIDDESLHGVKHVAKPKLGRMSNNIKILAENGDVLSDSGGYYEHEIAVYQEYCAPGSVRENTNFILGVWMTPQAAKWGKLAVASGICVREFDSDVNTVKNERFIPHILVD